MTRGPLGQHRGQIRGATRQVWTAALLLLVSAGVGLELLRPGHHVHGDGESRLHHHHFFLGEHSHAESAADWVRNGDGECHGGGHSEWQHSEWRGTDHHHSSDSHGHSHDQGSHGSDSDVHDSDRHDHGNPDSEAPSPSPGESNAPSSLLIEELTLKTADFGGGLDASIGSIDERVPTHLAPAPRMTDRRAVTARGPPRNSFA